MNVKIAGGTALAISLLAFLALSPALSFAAEDKYTSTSDCNAANDTWTITTTCVKTVGAGVSKNIQGGIQWFPSSVPPPQVILTDDVGQPILEGGGVVKMLPSEGETNECQQRYGTLGEGYRWSGYRSNVPMQDPDEASQRVFVVTYIFSEPVHINGASWFSSTMDETGDNTVVDAYLLIEGPVSNEESSWGMLKSQAR